MRNSQMFKDVLKDAKGFVKQNAPTILTSVGSVGVVGTAVLTGKATTKASKLLKEAKKEKGEELKFGEKMKIAAPCYIPAIAAGVTTIVCIVASNVLNKRQKEALITAYAALSTSFKDYKKKVDEVYGEGSDKKIDKAIFEDAHEKDDDKINETVLFYDTYSDQYFESTLFKVQEAEYFLNRELITKDYAYLNDFYKLLDLPYPDKDWKLGWTVGACLDMYWQGWVDFNHSKKTMYDGKECYHISFVQEPIEDFEDYC